MAERIGIVAVAQTKYEASKPAQNNGDLIWEVVEKVLQETGLRFEAQARRGEELFIDKVVSCSEDYWQGRTISDAFVHAELGATAMDATKVCADGSQAVYYAVMSILSGKHSLVLVVAHRKESETVRSIIENAAFDPIYLRPLGSDFLTAAAMQANRYMHKYGVSRESCARVVVKNRKNAKNNSYAQQPLDLTVVDVLNSRMLAYPLSLLDCKPISDGACAVILATEEKAKKITDKPVWVKGIGNCYDAHYLGDRDLADCDALIAAAKRAYGMAGIVCASREIDIAEVCEEYSYQELLWTEGLGFCERGEGGKLLDRGITEMGGALPINPAGGVLSGNPSGVAGMVRVAEAYLQLRGEAGARQVDGVKNALAHGVAGPCGQSHCVIVLGR